MVYRLIQAVLIFQAVVDNVRLIEVLVVDKMWDLEITGTLQTLEQGWILVGVICKWFEMRCICVDWNIRW